MSPNLPTVYSLTWLPEALEIAGLKVAETPGWRTRGRADMGAVRGVICHHTATARTVAGNMPTLNLLINGRTASGSSPALAGPLAHLGLGRDGTFYVVAAGRANHAGAGQWEGLVNLGNASFIGIEAENSGAPDDHWPDVQMDAYHRGVAAILRKIDAGANMCCGHKEYALPKGRKTDPSFDMPSFRGEVAALLSGKTPPPPIPALDDQQRATLRRGSTGPQVSLAQGRLGVGADGVFGARTEAALRVFQRQKSLVPDGILGPATWRALVPPDAPVNARAEAPQAAGPIDQAPVQADGLPPAEDAARKARVQGAAAIGPDGKRFASVSGPGFFTSGETTLAGWLDGLPAPPNVSQSTTRIVRAVSANEGGLEAVNSYDGAHLSFGVFQWTVGVESQPGELPLLLDNLRSGTPAAFEACFGGTGLAVQLVDATNGFLELGGQRLDSPAAKSVLRDASWAYRFWRAGHHPALRDCEFKLAADRIARFINAPTAGRPLGDWLKSELGVALVLDEHVNRPGHVPGTLEKAISELGEPAPDPDRWTTDDEGRLIESYLDARRTTTMTDSDGRAGKITAFVTKGQLSSMRGSYE